MAKVVWTLSSPSDPMYREGLQRYSPHWARTFDLNEPVPPPLSAERRSEPPDVQLRRLGR